MQFVFILVLIICIIVSLFAIQNGYPVDIDLFFVQFHQVSQSIVILLSAAFGAIVALLFGIGRTLKGKKDIRKMKKDLKSIETEMTSLKNAIESKDNEIEKLSVQTDTVEKDKLSILDTKNELLEENRILIKEKMDLEAKLEKSNSSEIISCENEISENCENDILSDSAVLYTEKSEDENSESLNQ